MRCIQTGDLASLSRDAAQAPRRRANLNLHGDLADPVQRLLIAIEPGSYVRPHRHTEPAKWECFIILAGSAALLLFDGAGRVVGREELAAGGPNRVVELPPGPWHSLVALEPGTVVFECKPGPYSPLADKDFAPWAPAEGSLEAAGMAARFALARVGDALP